MLKYPAIIDNTVLPIVVDGATPIKAKTLNDLRDAIIRIEKELGVKPSRMYTNVKTRLDEIDKIIVRMSGGDILRIIGTPKKGQTIIWNGRNWVPDTNFLAENLTTTGNFKAGRAISTSAYAGLIDISGKLILNKIPTPAISNPGDGIIFFDGTMFMVSENGRPYVPLNTGSGMTVPVSFVADGDLYGNNLSQTVIGLRDRKVDIATTVPKEKEALVFNSSTNTWVTGTDFGSNVISTTADFKTKKITVSDLATASSAGVLHWRGTPPTAISSKLIFDSDVAATAAIKGTKINPEFGDQNIITQKSISANIAYSTKIHLGSTSSPTLISTSGPSLPSTGNDGDVHFGTDGYVHMYKSGAWSLLKIDPSGPAYGDLSGNYPNPEVTGMNGVAVSPAPSPLPDGYVLTVSGTFFSFSSANFTKPNAVSGILPNSKQESQDLSGDLSGTTGTSKVVKILNKEVSNATPEDGYFLSWNGSKFAPTPKSTLASSLSMSGSADGDLSGSYPDPIVSKIQGLSIKSGGPLGPGNMFQVVGSDPLGADYLGFSAIDLADENIEGKLPEDKQDDQPMSGDVVGSTGAATVVKINGMLLSPDPPSDGYCLVYDDTGASPSWKPKSIATGGNPNTTLNESGDLGGSYPDPSVIRINGASVPAMSPATAVDGYFLKVKNSSTSPPSLEYGPLDLSSPLFQGVLPSSLQDSLSLSGDVSGDTASASITKIQNVDVQDFTFPTVPIGGLLTYDTSASSPKFAFSNPKLNELDGYAIMSSASSPSQEAGKGKIYYDITSPNKLKAIEGTNAAQDIIKSASTRALKVENLTATSLLSKITRHTATALPGGKILILGGHDGSTYLDTGYLYDPETGDLELLAATMVGGKRADHTATLTKKSDGTDIVVIIGGYNGTQVSFNEYYSVLDKQFYQISTPPGFLGPRYHTSTCLKDSTVLICGGEVTSSTSGIATTSTIDNAYIYYPDENQLKQIESNVRYIKYRPDPSNPSEIVSDIRPKAALNVARKNHTATLMSSDTSTPNPLDGYVLVAGGVDSLNKTLNYSELYDPTTKFFYSYTQPQKYDGCASIRLRDGRVLFTGGYDSGASQYKNDCYIYDPSTNLFEKTCPLNEARSYHTITLYEERDDVTVFILIGGNGSGANATSGYLKTAELYKVYNDKKTESATISKPSSPGRVPVHMNFPRTQHTSTKFSKDGVDYILVCGGYFPLYTDPTPNNLVSFAEIYYVENFYKLDSPMLYRRRSHSASLVGDNKIMISGGTVTRRVNNAYTFASTSAPATLVDYKNGEFYYGSTPTTETNQYRATSLVEYFDFENFSLSNLTENYFGSTCVPSSLFYDEEIESTQPYEPVKITDQTYIELPGNKVLFCGGKYAGYNTPSDESFLFDKKTKLFYRTNSMRSKVIGHTLTLLPNNSSVMCIGGLIGGLPSSNTQIYDLNTKQWSDGPEQTGNFAFHTATPMPDYSYGSASYFAIFIAGGFNPPTSSSAQYTTNAKATIYIPAMGSFIYLNDMLAGRLMHTCSYIGGGKFLIVGGNCEPFYPPGSSPAYDGNYYTFDANANSKAAEIYDVYGAGSNGSATPITMSSTRICHTSNLLSGNDVLISGGKLGTSTLSSVELFSNSSQTFAPKTPMVSGKFRHATINVGSDKLLIAYEKHTELYDARSNSTEQKNHSSDLLGADKFGEFAFSTLDTGIYCFILNSSKNIRYTEYTASSKTIKLFGGHLSNKRSGHISCNLLNGKILFIGGYSNVTNKSGCFSEKIDCNTIPPAPTSASVIYYDSFVLANNTKEIFDPITKSFSMAGSVFSTSSTTAGLVGCEATLITNPESNLDGYVVLTGGQVLSKTPTTNTYTFQYVVGVPTIHAGCTIAPGTSTSSSTYSKTINSTAYKTSYFSNAYTYFYVDYLPTSVENFKETSPSKKVYTNIYMGLNGNFLIFAGYDPDLRLGPLRTALYSGIDLNHYVPSVNKYNCATRTWSMPGIMRENRYLHAGTTLPNGNPLIAGGYNSTISTSLSLRTAETFNSSNSTFESIKQMSFGRARHSAVKLTSGKTLVIGGNTNTETSATSTKSSEIYGGGSGSAPSTDANTYINWKFDDPSWTGSSLPTLNFTKNDGTIGSVANLTSHSALAATNATSDSIYSLTALSTSSNALYSDIVKTFDPPLLGAVTVEIGSGKILILDGATTKAYIFDGSNGNITKTSNNMLFARNAYAVASGTRSTYEKNRFTATLFTDLTNKSKVLIVGGIDSSGNSIATAETFDVSTSKFDLVPISWTYGLMNHAATLLDSGDVLISGGITKSGATNTFRGASIFQKSTNSFVSYDINFPAVPLIMYCSLTGGSASDSPYAVPFSNTGVGWVENGSVQSATSNLNMLAYNSNGTQDLNFVKRASLSTDVFLNFPKEFFTATDPKPWCRSQDPLPVSSLSTNQFEISIDIYPKLRNSVGNYTRTILSIGSEDRTAQSPLCLELCTFGTSTSSSSYLYWKTYGYSTNGYAYNALPVPNNSWSTVYVKYDGINFIVGVGTTTKIISVSTILASMPTWSFNWDQGYIFLGYYNTNLAFCGFLKNLKIKCASNYMEMQEKRYNHTATKLPTGNVFIAGGDVAGTKLVTSSCELFDRSTNQFSLQSPIQSGSTSYPITNHSASLINNSLYLIGGQTLSGTNKVNSQIVFESNVSSLSFSQAANLTSTLPGNMSFSASAVDIPPLPSTDKKLIVVHGHTGTNVGSQVSLVRGISDSNGSWTASSSSSVIDGKSTYNVCARPSVHVIRGAEYKYDGYAVVFDTGSINPGSSRIELYKLDTNEHFSINQPSNKNVTLSLWIKFNSLPSSAAADGYIICKNVNHEQNLYYMTLAPGGISLKVNSSGKIILETSISRSYATMTSNATVVTGKWHHIAATYDSTGMNISLYIDGVIDNQLTSGTTTVLPAGTLDWGVGNFHVGGLRQSAPTSSTPTVANSINAIIDDVRIENVTKTPAQIQSMYSNGISNVWVPTGDLITGRYNHTASLIKNTTLGAPDKVCVIGGNQSPTAPILNIEKYDDSTKQYTQIARRVVISKNYTALSTDSNIVFLDAPPASSKTITVNLTLPDSASCPDGKLITASISPYLVSSDYTIKVLPSTSSSSSDAVPINTFNKSSVTLILDKSSSTPTWIPMDNAS